MTVQSGSLPVRDAQAGVDSKARANHRAGDLVRLLLGEITNRGPAIARTEDGQVVFVAYGAPGEEVVVEIDRVHKDHLTAHVVEVMTPSRDRIEPRCPYFGACGGCNYQHLAYERQLQIKREIVVETLSRIGKIDGVQVPETVPSPAPWAYRNQARFSTNRHGDVGFTRRNSNRLLRIESCFIVDPAIRELIPRLQGKGEGLHQIVVRRGVHTGEMMILPDLSERDTSIASGQSYVTEAVLGEPFRISPSAFFQVNTPQAERLVELVLERLQLQPHDVVADLYAGGGFFSRFLAPHCRSVLAIEISPQAAEDAAVNLAGLENVRYIQAAVEAALPGLDQRPAKVLLDPSRQGCEPAALDALIAVRPERIVYVSCDSATLARDLRRLIDGGFTLLEVQPLDMFPQTFHTECIATLERS